MSTPGFIYLIAHVDEDGSFLPPVKVGVTSNLKSRLSTIQTAAPAKIELAFDFGIPDRAYAEKLERELHKVLANWRVHGEWFDINPLHALLQITQHLDKHLAASITSDEILAHARDASGILEARKIIFGAVARFERSSNESSLERQP